MKKVLIVEDNPDLQKIYSEKLKASGFDVFVASDASLGFTMIKDDHPALILLDIMLPGKMNGFELLEILKKDENLKQIPVIVLTNLDSEKEGALKIGANDYLIKASLELSDLVKKVQENTR
jgi:DNA-binding response OmpR family regulator